MAPPWDAVPREGPRRRSLRRARRPPPRRLLSRPPREGTRRSWRLPRMGSRPRRLPRPGTTRWLRCRCCPPFQR
ncbi:MAG: hypothetical protein EOO71_36935 [Myxococcaceae bacterium]|nr:MAG: hypothetical protein EOO71_36935 [Myxococcaceae bacterium]